MMLEYDDSSVGVVPCWNMMDCHPGGDLFSFDCSAYVALPLMERS